MNINFPPVDENYIKSKVEAGYYSNATELVRDAVRKMREHDHEHYMGKKKQLWQALEVGLADIRAGRVVEYTPELLDEIEQDSRRNAVEGRIPNPDVCP